MPNPMPAFRADTVYQLLITLDGVRPAVRRRVLVPADLSLAELHDVIQAAMGWQGYHLWRFDVGGVEYGRPIDGDFGLPLADARYARLDAVAGRGNVLLYEYDFGDSWEHRVRVEKVLPREPGTAYPVCVLAERACPPEDCGGVWGYAELLDVLADPAHPERATMLEWLGRAFDPEAVDLAAIDRRLARLRRMSAERRRARPPAGRPGSGVAEAPDRSPEDAPGALDDVLRQLGQVVSEQPHARLDDLNAALATIAAGYNVRPQAELGNLSPAAVQRLLDADWEGATSVVQLDETLPLDALGAANTLHDARLLLDLLVEDGPVKATPKGNLPRAVVARFRDRMLAPEATRESWVLEKRVVREEDFVRLHHLRVMLEVAGLAQRRKGTFRRTRRGEQLADPAQAGALLARLVRTHFRTFNLAYLDGAGPAPGFQYTIAYTLHRFARIGDAWMTPAEAAGALLLPLVRDELATDVGYDRAALVVESRCLRPLEGFGLAEARDVEATPGEFLRRRAYRKTALFDRLFRFTVPERG